MCKRNGKSKENTLDDSLTLIIIAKMVAVVAVVVKLDMCGGRPAAELQVVMVSMTYAA